MPGLELFAHDKIYEPQASSLYKVEVNENLCYRSSKFRFPHGEIIQYFSI